MSDHPKENEIPLVLSLIGLGMYVLAGFIHSGTKGANDSMIVAPIIGALQTVILIIAAIIVASVLKIGFGDMKTAVMKFGGIALFAGGLNAILPLLGIVGLFVFLGLVMWLFEIELVYAVVLAVLNWIITIVVALAVASAFS